MIEQNQNPKRIYIIRSAPLKPAMKKKATLPITTTRVKNGTSGNSAELVQKIIFWCLVHITFSELLPLIDPSGLAK